MTIYGFVNDSCFLDPEPHMTDPENTAVKHGQFSTEQLSFFVDKFEIKDVRPQRLNHLSSVLQSPMRLTIDKSFVPEEVSILVNSSEEDLTYIFNIIEFILFRTIQLSEAALNEALLMDTDTYRNYVSESLRISGNMENVEIFDTVNSTYGILDWVQFKINVSGVILEFKFWIHNIPFGDDYPLSTISEVVPPMSPELLLDPSSITNSFDAVINSADTSQDRLSGKIQSSDYTDYISFKTKYIDPSDGTLRYLPFNVLYKGAVPKTLDIRQFIREYLLATELADEDTWKAVLPDLFIIAQFFIVPLWDNITIKPTREMYPTIAKIADVHEKMGLIFPDVPEDTRIPKLEMLGAAYFETPIAAIPDYLNQIDTAIRDLHPTYQRYSPMDISYQYQDDITKEFTTMFNSALAVGAGVATDDRLVINVLDERVFLSFVVDSIEYHVITKASYLSTIAVE